MKYDNDRWKEWAEQYRSWADGYEEASQQHLKAIQSDTRTTEAEREHSLDLMRWLIDFATWRDFQVASGNASSQSVERMRDYVDRMRGFALELALLHAQISGRPKN